MTEIARITLSDGVEIPQMGYGTFLIPPEETAHAVQLALTAGYRHIDTATRYGNEAEVGQALRESGLAREDVFVTTKLWNDRHRDAEAAFEESLERMGLETVDLYMIHWAAPSQGTHLAAWEGLLRIKESGRARSVGVANFPAPQLQEIIEKTGVAPSIHQIELHPYFQQRELRALHAQHHITTEAWGPLAQNKTDLLSNPVITEIAAAHEATPAQVVLAWHLAEGIVVIPKSVTPERITENLQAASLSLSGDEVEQIRGLDRPDGRAGADPADR